MLSNCLSAAGFSKSLSAHTVSGFRCCGLQTVQDIATQIRNGSVKIGIAMGADCVKEGRDALSLVDEVSLSPLEAVRPCESTSGGSSERGLDDPRNPQDQYAVQRVQNPEKAQACATQSQGFDAFTATSRAYDNRNTESDIQREEWSPQGFKPVMYEGNNCSILSP